MRHALLALPALLCSIVIAAPPSARQQRPLLPSPQHTRPSLTWSNWPNRLHDALFGQHHCDGRKLRKPKIEHQRPPPYMLADYGQDLVLRFNISTQEEAASLAEVADSQLLDIWEFSHDWVDIRLSTEKARLLLGLLPKSLQHSHKPLLREQALAKAIVDTYPSNGGKPTSTAPSHFPTRRPFSPDLEQATGAEINLFFADYQPFSVIEPWLRLLASLFTTHVRHINIGLSYEGRSIPGLRVGVHPTNSDDPDPPKRRTILVVGSLHAREWISVTTVNYLAYSLITGYGKMQSITQLLQDFDFVFIPTLNPDGYVYTWETDRLWRKNRQNTGFRFCQGIDLDHSFGSEWSAGSENECSESYSGHAPFEAVEAKRLADWAKNETENNNVDIVGFLDLHSYSQQILYPYSYSCDETPPGLENLEELAFGLGKAIRITHGHTYEIMQACEGNAVLLKDNKKQRLWPRVEPSGGSALDFFYNTMGVRYAYQIKLRDKGTYGFLLPKENIVPTGKEILNSLLYFGGFLADLYDDAAGQEKVDFTKLDMSESEAVKDSDALAVEEGADDSWVIVEDVIDPLDEVKFDLRRRRRR